MFFLLTHLNLRSFGPSIYKYQAFACYDLLDGGRQELSEYGVWTGNTSVQYLGLLNALFLTFGRFL